MAISLRGGGLDRAGDPRCRPASLDELMARCAISSPARASAQLRSSELTDPTITVTSLGDRGVESVFGVIYPPQVAIVGFGCRSSDPGSSTVSSSPGRV